MPTITAADRVRLQAHLRQMLHSPALTIAAVTNKSDPVEIRIGGDVLGTVDQVDKDGERSWAVTLIVLGEDLES